MERKRSRGSRSQSSGYHQQQQHHHHHHRRQHSSATDQPRNDYRQEVNEVIFDCLMFLDKLIADRARADDVPRVYASLHGKAKRLKDRYQNENFTLKILIDYLRLVITYDWRQSVPPDTEYQVIRAPRDWPTGIRITSFDSTSPVRSNVPCFVSLKVQVNSDRIVETVGHRIEYSIGNGPKQYYKLMFPPNRRDVKK